MSLEISYTSDEMMTVSAARMLSNGAICFVGIGLPSTAANLACLLHAPDVVLIYEPGPIGAKPAVLPLSIGDGSLAEQADAVVSTPEIFRYWLQGGRVDIGFLGAAQIDRYATINATVIGNYHRPTVRSARSGRRARNQYVRARGSHHCQAIAEKLCRETRLCHFGWILDWGELPQASQHLWRWAISRDHRSMRFAA